MGHCTGVSIVCDIFPQKSKRQKYTNIHVSEFSAIHLFVLSVGQRQTLFHSTYTLTRAVHISHKTSEARVVSSKTDPLYFTSFDATTIKNTESLWEKNGDHLCLWRAGLFCLEPAPAPQAQGQKDPKGYVQKQFHIHLFHNIPWLPIGNQRSPTDHTGCAVHDKIL